MLGIKQNKKVAIQWFKNNHPLVKHWDSTGVKWCLHHWDTTLRHTNLNRYNMWMIDDLIPVTYSWHSRMHASNKSAEHRRKISDKMKGDNNPSKRADVKKKISEAHSGSGNPMAKAVICVETGEVFNTLTEASIWLGKDKTNIWLCCKGKQQTTGGYHWKYFINR